MYIIKQIFTLLIQCIRDFILFFLPNDWLSSKYFRPVILRLMGMKCGKNTVIANTSFYGKLRNVEVGNNAAINRNVTFVCGGKIIIGNNVGIGFHSILITGTHEKGPSSQRWGKHIRKDIIIEDGAWIASNVLIGPGVTIGKGCIVGAGAVVIRSTPPNCLIGGNPAKVIKELEE